VAADELSANTGIVADRLIELAEAVYLPHWNEHFQTKDAV
jgi:hypothetical protein